MPVNETSKHATQLLDLKQLFAITHDLQFYTTFEMQELQKYTGDKLIE